MMFLIAKIVRGRRLLHELEQEAKDEQCALDAASNLAQIPKRFAQRHRTSSHGLLDADEELQSTSHGNGIQSERSSVSQRRKKTVRQKTDGSMEVLDADSDKALMRRTSSMPSVCEPSATVVQPSGPALRHYDYDSKLNRLQKKALRFTWHRLQTRNGGKRVENVFEEVFDRLVRQIPQIREMFTTRMFLCAMNRHEVSSLRDHARVTVKMIEAVIKNLEVDKTKRTDTGSAMDPKLIGRKHGVLRPYGMTGNYWEKLGETIIDVVLAQEAVRDLPGAGQAWVVLTACLVDQLRAGFEETKQYSSSVMNKSNTVLHHATQHLHSMGESHDVGEGSDMQQQQEQLMQQQQIQQQQMQQQQMQQQQMQQQHMQPQQMQQQQIQPQQMQQQQMQQQQIQQQQLQQQLQMQQAQQVQPPRSEIRRASRPRTDEVFPPGMLNS